MNGELEGNIKKYKDNKLIYEGSYKEGERNGFGKEYSEFNNRLEYEGYYLNGIKHGYGKEYKDKKLIFKGEYLYGNKWKGKYKTYNKDKLIFEGEYKNGKIWNGIGYDKNDKKDYEMRNGNGKLKLFDDNNKIIFEVEYKNGRIWNGKGDNYEIINGNGNCREYNEQFGYLIYEREYLNGERNGKDKEYNKNDDIIFEGEYKEDKKNRKDKEYNKKGEIIYEEK